ncbi:MAG: glycosyltransferase family 39 protein [Solirubrobacteraceae bacterium]
MTDNNRRRWVFALAAVTLLGAVLRLVALRRVPDNPFYDAAVRSMTHSLHNFFFGAYEPGASASIDKPPFDLWLQVITVKLLGFSSTTLKLPSALAGTVAVPLLYDLVRRIASRPPALAAAAVLAVLPISVVTARSDTMDSLMMALLIGVAWLLLRYAERRELRWLVLASLLLGLDFNVKLFEALVALPALLIFLWMCWRGEPFAVRARGLLVAFAAFTVVALSWLTIVSLAPQRERPYPIGSTNGSVWNAVFVFNGSDRILKAPHPSRFDATPTSADSRPTLAGAVQPRRKHGARAPSAPAGPLRLFRRSVVDFGGLIGTVLFASLLLGAAALFRRRPREQLHVAAVVGTAVWLLSGLVLFSLAGRVHPRYLEAFTPAVAATLGVSICALARERRGALLLLAGLVASVLEASLVTGQGTLVRGGLVIGVLAGLATAGLLLFSRRAAATRWPVHALSVGALVSLLAFPLARDVRLIRDHSGVQAASPLVKGKLVAALSTFLRAHQGSAKFEFAASAPSLASPLLVRDVRPILLLTTVDGRPLESLSRLRADAAAGKVSYVITRGRCPHPPYRLLPACAEAVKWVVAHAEDVTAQLGVPGTSTGLLYALNAGAPSR